MPERVEAFAPESASSSFPLLANPQENPGLRPEARKLIAQSAPGAGFSAIKRRKERRLPEASGSLAELGSQLGMQRDRQRLPPLVARLLGLEGHSARFQVYAPPREVRGIG